MHYWVHIPRWFQRLLPWFWWRLSANAPPTLYLTFDDGPTPEITAEVLKMLAPYKAQATFFCLGKNVDAHPHLYREIIDKGHAVGNHTYSHANGWQTNLHSYLEEAARAKRCIQSALFRPPYGRILPHQAWALRKKGYRIVMFDVLSGDFDISLNGQQCAQNVIEHARPGSIVLFHDSVKAWPRLQKCLPQILEHFAREGYCFAHLPKG